LLDVFSGRASRIVRGGKIALVEGADLIGFECTYHRVENASVVEDD
jgi:hypothetical protein